MDQDKNEYLASFESVVENDSETLEFKFGDDIEAKVEWFPLNNTWGDRYFQITDPAYYVYMDEPSLDIPTIREYIYKLKQSYDPSYFDSAKVTKLGSLAFCLVLYIQAAF